MVLLCFDGSPTAKHAIAIAHASVGHEAALVLHVWQPSAEFFTPDSFGGGSEAIAHEGRELARSAGFAVEARSEPAKGSVWPTIIDVAHDIDADLIVVGARGLSTVESALLGSVSNAVVHHSKRPVLVVPQANAS
jgi:nucleotide-binding universal stress UspA family protein